MGFFILGGGAFLFAALRSHKNARYQKINKRLTANRQGVVKKKENLALVSGPLKNTGFDVLVSLNFYAWLLCAIGAAALLFTPSSAHWVFLSVICWTIGGGYLLVTKRQSAQRAKQLGEQFPEALDLLVRGARVGVSLEQNICAVGNEMPEPVSGLFKRVSELLEIGVPFEGLFVEIPVKFQIREFRYLVATLSIQRKSGGQYGDTLENLARVLRERQELDEKVKSVTAEPRLASSLIVGIVGLSVLMLYLTNPSQFEFLFRDPSGQSILFYSFTSLLLGVVSLYILVRSVK
ncbi:type II secretion system F family protein [Sneathiella aquimaris]|uniref:type II secretion system F family protein n=1 Tax=Sneathiella aquimaris TaxID=2599305 RepID=UPI00146DC855|nr:type II secretion system F family protein [Sneathiella aquimaris]